MRIVYEYPGRGGLRRFFRAIVRLFGAILILVSLIAAMPLFFLLAALIISIVDGKSGPPLRESEMSQLAIAFVIMIVAWFFGRKLVRGRRQLVLFLRRFGFVGATEALTFAVTTVMGGSWRLITLDDHQVAPVGTGKGMRWSSILVGLIAIAIVGSALIWLFGGGLGKMMSDVVRDAPRQGNLVQTIFGAIVAAFIVALVVGLLVIVLVTFFAVVGLFSWGTYFSVRRAERSKKLEVTSVASLEKIVRTVSRRSRRVFSPRLAVVRVAMPVWQQAGLHLASVCAAVVVDVSEPTDNLLWEIATLKPRLQTRFIVVADQEHLNTMTTGPAQGLEIQQRLLHVLDGEEILAYSNDRAGRKRFARALRTRLESPLSVAIVKN